MARKVRREPKRKLSTAAWFGIGCGAALVLGLMVLGTIWVLVKSGPPLPPEATAQRSAPATPTSPDAAPPDRPNAAPAPSAPAQPSAPPLRQQIEHVERAARSERPVPTRVVIRQDELNSLLQQESPGDVSNMRVYLGDGTMAAIGDVQWRGQTVSLTVRARPFVSGGELDVQVLEVRVGRLAAPAAVHDEVHRQLQRGVRQLSSRNKVQIQSVTVHPGTMILSGQVGGR